MDLLIPKYNFLFEVNLIGFLLHTPTIIMKLYENEDLRTLRTRRKQLDADHIMINFIIGIRYTPFFLPVHLRIILVGNQFISSFLIGLHTGRPLTHSNYTKSCINTIVLLRMST
jgi:hypothetical protein